MADRAGMRRPGTITLATTVMVIRAVIGLLGIVLVFVVKDDIRQAIENSDHGLSASEVDTATNLAIGLALVFAVLVFLFYIWLATKIRRGRNWARIATIVIAALGVLAAIGTAVRPTADAARGWSAHRSSGLNRAHCAGDAERIGVVSSRSNRRQIQIGQRQ